MFNTFTQELQSSWHEPDVIRWKTNAKKQCKFNYLAYGGSQWHAYNYKNEKQLLQAKICFAMFGKPIKVKLEGELIDAYSDEQREKSSFVLDKILKLYSARKSPNLLVGIIFVICKMGDKEFSLPLFAVSTSKDSNDPKARNYVDINGRTYEDWQDWKDNNTLSMLKYCYPRNGFYTCSSSCQYEFDPKKEPDIDYGNSPQCNISSRIFEATDAISAVTSLGCGIIGLASMFTPLAPAVLISSAVFGGTSATYGAMRAVGRLVDKGQHSEDMADLESIMLYLSIAATPLNFTAGLLNANLARGAQIQGRIFNSSTRMMATVINFGTLGVDSLLVGLGLANLVEKSQKNQITTLDIFQFSMSLFFFTNTLIKPKIASSIIKQAQEQHIQKYLNSMTEGSAKTIFSKFVNDNKKTGTIKDTSKIVRAINRIDNPDRVFGGLQNAEKVMIGSRKGNTILVTDNNQNTNRINPNKVLFSKEQVQTANFRPVNIKTKGFGGRNVEQIMVNRKKLFNGISNKEKARVNRVLNDSARNNPEVVQLALDISDNLKCSEIEQFLSVVEIVGAKVQSDTRTAAEVVNEIRTNCGQFVDNIRRDVTIAMQIAKQQVVNFRDPLKAVYHYRKHGQEFATKAKRQSVKVYLNKVPNYLITDYNLVEATNNQDGTITKIYNTVDNKFASVVENVDSRIIKTMFESPGSYDKFMGRLAAAQKGWTRPDFLNALPQIISNAMGFRGCPILLILENGDALKIE